MNRSRKEAPPSKLLKNTHMLRCRSIASLRRTVSTLVDFSRASHLALFEQPARGFFQHPPRTGRTAITLSCGLRASVFLRHRLTGNALLMIAIAFRLLFSAEAGAASLQSLPSSMTQAQVTLG